MKLLTGTARKNGIDSQPLLEIREAVAPSVNTKNVPLPAWSGRHIAIYRIINENWIWEHALPGKTIQNQDPSSDEILETEFEYIARTAFQADEDHARVSSFYLVAVGSLIAALFSTQLFSNSFDPIFIAWAFSGLFFFLTILGTLTTLQLSRLRAAWHDSMLAMNQLKDYWIHRSKDRDLEKAFRWDTRTLPRKYKPNSVSFFQTVEVALLSGITFGAAVYFMQKGIGYACLPCNWAYAISFGTLAFLFELWIYKLNLGK